MAELPSQERMPMGPSAAKRMLQNFMVLSERRHGSKPNCSRLPVRGHRVSRYDGEESPCWRSERHESSLVSSVFAAATGPQHTCCACGHGYWRDCVMTADVRALCLSVECQRQTRYRSAALHFLSLVSGKAAWGNALTDNDAALRHSTKHRSCHFFVRLMNERLGREKIRRMGRNYAGWGSVDG